MEIFIIEQKWDNHKDTILSIMEMFKGSSDYAVLYNEDIEKIFIFAIDPMIIDILNQNYKAIDSLDRKFLNSIITITTDNNWKVIGEAQLILNFV